jgi:hypothetical protein
MRPMGRLQGQEVRELLQAAEAAGYDVLLTVDQGIPHQVQSGSGRIAVIVLRSRTNQIEDLRPLVPVVLEARERPTRPDYRRWVADLTSLGLRIIRGESPSVIPSWRGIPLTPD